LLWLPLLGTIVQFLRSEPLWEDGFLAPILQSGFLVYFVYLFVASDRDRHSLQVVTNRRTIFVNSPTDTYADGKVSTWALREVLQACPRAGLTCCVDRTAV